MKQVQDKDGNVSEVENNIPCHAGIDGALPTLYTEAETAANGIEQAARKAAWDAKSSQRAASAVKEKRRREYPVSRAEADTLWHYLKWMKVSKSADYLTLPTEVTSWFDSCEQVKTDNPE